MLDTWTRVPEAGRALHRTVSYDLTGLFGHGSSGYRPYHAHEELLMADLPAPAWHSETSSPAMPMYSMGHVA